MTTARQRTATQLTAARARTLVRDAMAAAGAAPQVADAVADHVVEAELAGHPSHGLRQVPGYCASSGRPGFDLRALPTIMARRPAVATIDAGGGLGYLALAMAVDIAAAAAREHGIAASAVRQCGHAGRAGAWAERGAKAGCATMIFLGGCEPPFVVAAAPGTAPSLHTNPIAVAVPADGSPLLLDMATSMVAEGKVHVALAAGTPLPPGSIQDRDGQASTDPADFFAGGSLLPAGGHKGFGLAAMIEALAVAITGADRGEPGPRDGALVLCIDAAAFQPAGLVAGSVQQMCARIRASGRRAEALAPGDPEARSRAASAGRIDADPAVLAELRRLAGSRH